MPGLFEGFIVRHKRGVTLSVLVLVSLLGILISNRAIVIQPKQVGLSVVAFFQKGFSGIFRWFADTAGSIRQLRQAREELSSTRQKLLSIDQTNREIVQLRRENQLLREQLGFTEMLPVDRIAAEVIAEDHDNLFSTITINKGSRHGVMKDMPVVAFQQDLEGLVGKVVAVGPGSSQILPLYDPQCEVSARLERSRFEGLLSGQGKDRQNLLVRYVKKLAKDQIEYGDMVVTAGLGGLYPKGINIGRVRDWKAETYETSLELQVEPIIDFSRLEYVFILKPGDETGETDRPMVEIQTAPQPATQAAPRPAPQAAPRAPQTAPQAAPRPAQAAPQAVPQPTPQPEPQAEQQPEPQTSTQAEPEAEPQAEPSDTTEQ
jgi:rod shape-determining protein MreC